jgi:hypothetical protein
MSHSSSPPNDGGPAFPQPYFRGLDGMSLRDYFAAQALTGVLASAAEKYLDAYGPGRAHERIAEDAYFLADAMLVARSASPSAALSSP